MAEGMGDLTPQEAYLEGRLLGLNELITILGDAMAEEGPAQSALVKSIVMHISNEMTEVINELREEHGKHPIIKEATAATKVMVQEAKKVVDKPVEQAQPVLKKNVEVAEDLMKNLMALRDKSGEGL